MTHQDLKMKAVCSPWWSGVWQTKAMLLTAPFRLPVPMRDPEKFSRR